MKRTRQALSPALGATLGIALCCLTTPLRADAPQPAPPSDPAPANAAPPASQAPSAAEGSAAPPTAAPAGDGATPTGDGAAPAGTDAPAPQTEAAPLAGPVAGARPHGTRDALDCDPDAAAATEDDSEPWQAVLARVGMSFTLAGLAVGGTTVPLGVISTRESTNGEFEGSSRLNLQLMAVTIGFPAAAVTLLGIGMWTGGALSIPDPDEVDEEDDEEADKTAGATVVPVLNVGLGSLSLRLDF